MENRQGGQRKCRDSQHEGIPHSRSCYTSRMQPTSDEDKAPWWGIAVLYAMLLPFAIFAYLAFKAFRLVWNLFDGSGNEVYALAVFAVGGVLVTAYVVGIARQIWLEFVTHPRTGKSSSDADVPERTE